MCACVCVEAARREREHTRTAGHADVFVRAGTQRIENQYAVSYAARESLGRSRTPAQMDVREDQAFPVEVDIDEILEGTLPGATGLAVLAERAAVEFEDLDAIVPCTM